MYTSNQIFLIQFTEWRYKDLMIGVTGEGLDEEEYLYLGEGETRGLLMISPPLQEFITSELHNVERAKKD